MSAIKIYQTTDRRETATLISCGNPIMNIKLSDRENPEFTFEKTTKLKETLRYYRHSYLLVDPKKISTAHNQIDTAIRFLSGVCI